MAERTLSRREVLAGGAATLALGGAGRASGTDGRVEVLSVALTYDLPAGESYERVHLDRPATARLDADERVLHLPRSASPGRLPDRVLLHDGALHALPTRVQRVGPPATLPTAVTAQQTPAACVLLAGPHRMLQVRLLDGRVPTVRAGGHDRALPPGEAHSLALGPRPVEVRTLEVGARVETADVPARERARRTERGTARVAARPRLAAANLGEVEVVADRETATTR